MEISEIDGAHIPPRDKQTFTDKLQQVLHDVGKWIIGNDISISAAKRYDHRLIHCVNRNG